MTTLASTIKRMSRKTTRWYHLILDFLVDLWDDYPGHWFFLVKTWYTNFMFFFPHIRDMRSWDYSFNINLFVHSLRYTANGLKNGHSLLCDRYYRRCLTAAGLLDRAYHFEAYNDKSYRNWLKRNPRSFVKLDNGNSKLVINHKDSVEYSDKMSKIIHKRLENQEKQMKKEAWEYVHKHIEYFWD